MAAWFPASLVALYGIISDALHPVGVRRCKDWILAHNRLMQMEKNELAPLHFGSTNVRIIAAEYPEKNRQPGIRRSVPWTVQIQDEAVLGAVRTLVL
jgi:hypothetical protein